jgi:uncharacterized protein YdeI (YjbR/CyaY-like superfamily)
MVFTQRMLDFYTINYYDKVYGIYYIGGCFLLYGQGVRIMIQKQFADRNEFRTWQEANYNSGEGLWLIFDKTEKKSSPTAAEALEEALCFGWIDGQIKSIDDTEYIKYFKERRKGSMWSDRNKKIIAELSKQGMMTQYGLAKIDEAKTDGTWDAPAPQPSSEDFISLLENALKSNEIAYANFMKMAPSARKGYAMHYSTAKSEETRSKRLLEIMDRLEKNLKPMEKDKSRI